MANSATLVIEFLAKTDQAQAALDTTSTKAGKAAGAFRKMAVPAAAALGGVAVLGKKAADAASELQQAQGAVESVFGKSSKAVEEYASTSASRLGVAKSEYLNSAALMGSALQNAGFSASKAADETDKAFSRSADLAATFGGTAAEAMDAINAAVSRGEFDPLEKYGVSLNATAVNAELAKRGQDDLTGAQLANAKATVVLDSIYAKTAKTEGQFARESDTAAGAQQIAAASAKNMAAALGEALLPAMSAIAAGMANMATWAADNTTTIQVLAGVIAGLASAILLVNAAMKIYAVTTKVITAVTKAWAVAQRVLNVAMRMNPIGLIITALVALGAGLVLAYKKSETFRNIVNGVFNAVKSVVLSVVSWFGKWVPQVFSAVVQAVKVYINVYKTVIVTVFNVVKKVITVAVNAVKKVITTAWKVISTVVRTYVNVYKTVITTVFRVVSNLVSKATTGLKNAFSNAWNAVVTKVRSATNTLVGIVKGIPQKFKNGLSDLTSKVRDVFGDAMTAGKDKVTGIGNTIIDWIKDIPGKISGTKIVQSFKNAGKALIGAIVDGMKNAGGVISGIAGNVWDAVKSMLNTAIDKINRALEFKINLPGPKDITVNPPNIPHLAEGGIVRRPTLALVGEAGPEAVVPLNRAMVATTGGDDNRIFIEVNGALDPEAVARQIRKILEGSDRRRRGTVLPRRAGGRIAGALA